MFKNIVPVDKALLLLLNFTVQHALLLVEHAFLLSNLLVLIDTVPLQISVAPKIVVSRLEMYRTYVLLARLTKVRR
jgi:hypothetical protein